MAELDIAGAETGGHLRLALAIPCAILPIVMMILTLIDVAGRYAFNSPLPGATA